MDNQENKVQDLPTRILESIGVKGIASLLLFAVLLAGCETVKDQTTVANPVNISAEEVSDNANQYAGQTVTVRSEAIEKISESTFTIEDLQLFDSEPILVVNASGKTLVVPEPGTTIQATGEVRNFVFSEIESEYGLSLDADTYRNYENQPALIAQSIALAPKPEELTREPQKYYGKILAVTGEVEEIRGTNAFTLEENQLFGGQDLLVLHTTPTIGQPYIREGEKLAITGVLRPFVVAELERDYDLDWDLEIQQQLEVEYSGVPVLVADDVYPSTIPDNLE